MRNITLFAVLLLYCFVVLTLSRCTKQSVKSVRSILLKKFVIRKKFSKVVRKKVKSLGLSLREGPTDFG